MWSWCFADACSDFVFRARPLVDRGMFYGAKVFAGDLSQWDVGSVTHMGQVTCKPPPQLARCCVRAGVCIRGRAACFGGPGGE